jgi:Domain of unknown function (DUF4388)
MTELSGTLEGIGLAPLVSFLTGLGKSGRLTIADGPMAGEVFLDGGQVIGAAFDAERGLAALDAIGLALGGGRFGFAEQETHVVEHNVSLSTAELRQHLDDLQREAAVLAAAIPSLSAVPHLVVDESGTEDEIGLDRDTLRLLMQIDGRRSVAELARERGLLRTLKQLARLSQLKLARIEAVHAAASGGSDWRASYASQSPAAQPHPQAEPEPEPQPEQPPAEQAGQQGQRSGGSTWARWRGSS